MLERQVDRPALLRPDGRQDLLIEAGQTAVALVHERLGAEGDEDLAARDEHVDRQPRGAPAVVNLPELQGQHLERQAEGIVSGLTRQEQEVVVAAERVGGAYRRTGCR